MNMQVPSPSAPLMSERRVGIVCALLATIGSLSMSLYTPAMPEIERAFGTTEAAVKMSLSLYFAGFAFAQLFCGPLSDGLGRRPVTVAFMTIYTGASFLALFAPDIHVLIAARFLQGVGAAVGVAMSRAIVRDLFTHEQSARIMNLVGIILAIGPAAAPTIGGLTMEIAGWHAIFLLMAVLGIGIAAMAILAIRETVQRDLSRLRPLALARSYGSLLANPYFMTASMTNAGATGAIYAQATVLPFIMMNRAGFTPSQFGLSMLMQTLSYIVGSICVRVLMPRFGAVRLVPVGLVMMGVSCVATAALLRLYAPNFWVVFVPVAFFAFGIAFVTAAMTTAAMAPFPKNAGAAAALMGFMQMGTGLLGGAVGALLGDPVFTQATVIPLIGLASILSFVAWKRLGEPAHITRVDEPLAAEPEPPLSLSAASGQPSQAAA